MQENICESKAYLSNDPNIINIKQELAATAKRKANKHENENNQYDLNDFENLNEI